MRGSTFALVLIVLSGCQSYINVVQEDGGTGDAGISDSASDRQGPPSPRDAGSLGDASGAYDAQGQSDASCGPGSGVYPCCPFGTSPGDTIANETLRGYYDSDSDGQVTDESLTTFDLARYYLLSSGSAKLLYINVSAPWCSTCQEEAARLRALYQEFHPKGVEFLTVLWDLESSSEARDWAAYFNLPFAVSDDTKDERFVKYWDGSGVPMGMFIELRTMKILSIFIDWNESGFRAKLGHYLSSL